MCILPFLLPLLHYLETLFTSKYFPSLHGKNSTFFHPKHHHNISTKDMISSQKCIYLFFTLGKQLQIIHEQQMIHHVFFLPPFIACVYLPKYQQPYSKQTTLVKCCLPEIYINWSAYSCGLSTQPCQ